MFRATLGGRHPNTLTSILNLGALLFPKGDLAAAELLLREGVAGMRETLGNRHPQTLRSIVSLGTLLVAKGGLDRATTLVEDVLHDR